LQENFNFFIIQTLIAKARSCLSEDGQAVYHLIQAPHYFLGAKYIFSALLEDTFFQVCYLFLFA